MSRKATRISDETRVDRFDYGNPDAPRLTAPTVQARSIQVVPPGPVALLRTPSGPQLVPAPDLVESNNDSAAERQAFAAGYAHGERAGIDAASRQLDPIRDRLAQTVNALSTLREDVIYRTERQVVELALAIAARILHREISLDRELLLVMARLALERMGEVSSATIRLNPEDDAAARGGRDGWPGGVVTIVADPAVEPGACLVQSNLGQVEVGVDAQLRELATSLLGTVPTTQAASSGR